MGNLYLYDEHDYARDVKNERSRKYYYTGFKKVDKLARPRAGEITMVPAFTDHGKSSVLRNMAFNMFLGYQDMHFLYYAFEEQSVDTYTGLSRLWYYDKNEAITGAVMTQQDYWKHIVNNDNIGAEAIGYQAMLSQRIHVVDVRIRPSEIEGHIESVIGEYPIEVVFVDYLQDMKPERQINNAPAELEDTLECLEDVTKKNNIATIVAAQYRPDIKNPQDKYDVVGLTKVFGSSSVYKKSKLFLSVFNETAFLRVFKNGEQNPKIQRIEFDILKQKGQRYAKNLCYNMCSNSNRIVESPDEYVGAQ